MIWNMFKVNNKNNRTTSSASFCFSVCLLLTWNIFHTFSSVSILDFVYPISLKASVENVIGNKSKEENRDGNVDVT